MDALQVRPDMTDRIGYAITEENNDYGDYECKSYG